MKKTVIFSSLILALVTPVAAPAPADSGYIISTGREGGSYFTTQGPKVVKYLRGAGVTNVTFVPSSGSLENLSRVAKNEAQIGFTQADALLYFKKTDPVGGTNIDIGAPLTKECLFVVSQKNGKVDDVDDLKKKGITVAAGADGDGSRATFDYMGVLDKGFKEPNISDMGGALGLAQLAAGQADAFLFVTNPDTLQSSELFQLVMANPKLKIVNANSWSLNDKLPNGDVLYSKEKVVTKPGIFGDSVNTICMQSYVVTYNRIPVGDKEKFAKAFLRMAASSTK